ncbi:MAG: heme-binding protein [Flavobacteriaceae bacterium]|nr:heme-binding protein [Flavobacteriaceae bacterium]
MGQRYESQPYEVLQSMGDLEIRFYPAAMMAKTKANTGNPFSTLFRYISGANQNNEKIEMTTPVYMYPENGTSAMEFVLPKKYMQQDAPAPSGTNVKIYESKPGYFAAVRYSGYSNASKVKTHTDRLMGEIQKHNLKAISNPVVLSYDSPYKVLNRRNEILVEVSYTTAD